MGRSDIQVYCHWTCFHSFVSRHSVTRTPQYTTKYANYAYYPFALERASIPPTRGKAIPCSPYYLPNLSLSPPSQINSYPRKTHHLPVFFMKHPKLSLVGTLNLYSPSARMHSVFIRSHPLPAY